VIADTVTLGKTYGPLSLSLSLSLTFAMSRLWRVLLLTIKNDTLLNLSRMLHEI
jgi:hypothetical protein